MKKGVVIAGMLLLISGCGRAPEDKTSKEEELFPETTVEAPEAKQQATGAMMQQKEQPVQASLRASLMRMQSSSSSSTMTRTIRLRSPCLSKTC